MKYEHKANPAQALMKAIEALSRSRPKWRVWSDFVECAALSLSNAVDRSQYTAREARYMEIIRDYPGDDALALARCLAHVVNALEAGFCDCLGTTFMSLELGSHWHGQYFTPYPVASMMAQMIVNDPRPTIATQGFFTVMEPAAGAGAMIIAVADHVRSLGINYQQHMHVAATDVDLTAALMSYVQFSLLHIPAVVIHGNSLSCNEWSRWYTPAHILDRWQWKLQRHATSTQDDKLIRVVQSVPEVLPVLDAPTITLPALDKRAGRDQLSLF
jgi:hypothetical protein